MYSRKSFIRSLVIVLLFVMISMMVRSSLAADAVVGTGSPASCTEAAINTALATAQSGGGTITFNCTLATISFTDQKLITSHVVIDGGGLITLSGGDVTRLFRVQTGRSLTLRNIILTDGYSGNDYGGAIYVDSGGTLTVEGSTIKDSATNDWAGGAIVDFGGTLTLKDSTIANNQSSYGAINSVGTLDILRTTIMSNTATLGGGGLSVGGDVTIADSHIHHNSAKVAGALYITAAGDVTITDSTFDQNDANGTILAETGGGAIVNNGYLWIERSTFWGNRSEGSGGAIQSGYSTYDSQTTILQSAFFGNQAVVYGGAMYNQGGNFTLINSTLSDNRTQESGGGLASFLGPATLYHVTAVDNQGGNLNQITEAGFNDTRQKTTVGYSAIAGGAVNCQVTGSPAPDPLPYFSSQGNNRSSDNSCATYLSLGSDTNNSNAKLNPLGDNGGTTLTHLPQTDSPLIDAMTCTTDFLVDQRGIVRPQNGLCDIGAVEIASNTTGPMPTAVPSATAVASPTPQPTPTLPAPGASPPAFSPIQLSGGLRPTINVSVNRAYGGQSLTVSGNGVAGYNQVRIFSIEKGQTVGAVEAAVINGSYQAQLVIPYTMPTGATKLCAAPVGATNGELACTNFTVDPMPNGSATGQISDPAIGSWNAQANLIDTRGRLIQTSPINGSGQFQFNNIAPGVYQYAIGGNTTKPVNQGELTVGPSSIINIDPTIPNIIACLSSGNNSSYLLLDRGTTNSPSDKYAPVVMVSVNPFLPSAVADLQLDWGAFQRGTFGYYVSGVARTENFVAIPQVSGTVGKVEFNLRQANGTLVDQHIENAAPYTVQFNMGALDPSDANGDPYIEVIPYVAGEKQCPSEFPVQVIKDPMKASAFRTVDSHTTWNKNANVYQFSGVIPNIPGLPLNFPIPPTSVAPIPNFGRFQNKADAGIYIRGTLTEDGVVWMEGVNARAELILMSVPLINPRNFNSPPIPNAHRELSQLWEFSFKLPPNGGRFEVLPPIEVGIPFVDTPVFSFFGIDFVVGTSAKAGFTAYLNGEVYPFQPRAIATLTPSGYGEGELTLGLGLGGVVSAGGGMGFRLQLDAPITASVPDFKVTTSICPTVSTFVHLYVRALLQRKDLKQQIASYSPGCYPLRPMADPELTLPEVLAAPAVAVSTTGQVLSAYVEDTAVTTPPQLQIITRFQNGDGTWQPATAVSNPQHSTATPVVGFAGAGQLPVVVWIANTFNEISMPSLANDFNAQVSRQEIFYSWYASGSWQTPVRLTNDLLADGLPSLASSPNGAILAWVRDMDGNPQTRADQRIAVAEFNPTTQQFGDMTLLTGGATGLNAEPQIRYDGATPYLVWTYDSDGNLATADDRRLAIAHKENGAWIVELPPNLPAAVDSPTIVGGQNGVMIAFLVREPDKDKKAVGIFGTNGALWTARQGSGAWHATPVRGSLGEFVYGERPLLAVNQTETLLAFRRFGAVGSNAGLGQLSLSTAQGAGLFSPPIYLTDDNQQAWQLAMAVNPVNQQVVLVHVERPSGNLAPGNQLQSIAANETVMQTNTTTLNTAADPVLSVFVPTTSDPALAPLQLSPAVAAGETLTVTAVLRNLGRNPAQAMTVSLYSGTPGNGTLLGSQAVSGSILFNQQRTVAFVVTAVAGQQSIYTEVTTSGGNLTTANDRAMATLGDLTAPFMHEVVASGFTDNALDISWYPAADEYVSSYRILRSNDPAGPFELIGESVFAIFTDTLAKPGGNCYAVQSYNGAGHLSALSDTLCYTSSFDVFLPMLVR